MIFVVASGILMAQQAPMFTNYSNSYASVNPGFGGLSDGVNVMGIYRDQWHGFITDAEGKSISPKTMLISGDMPVKLLKGGASLSIMKDDIVNEHNINVNMGYSFHIDLGGGTLGMGLALNLLNRSVDFSNFHPNVQDPIIPSGEQSDMLIDANFGLFWQVPETFYIGMSITNLFETKGKLLVENAATSASFMGDRTFYLMAGYEYQFNNPVFVLLPSLCLMSDIASTQINAGAKILYNNKVWFGVNYRYQESVAAMVGFKIKDLQISYSYDVNTMGLDVQGSHEICVSYFVKLDLEKSARIYRNIRYL